MRRALLAWLLWKSPMARWHPTIQFERVRIDKPSRQLGLRIWLKLWGKWMKLTHGERYHV